MKPLFFFALCVISTALLAQPAATVLSTANQVSASHNGTTRILTRGSTLEVGDAIMTGANAKANIKYSNGTLVNISSNSNYKILAYAPKASDVQIKAELSQGTIASKTNGKTKESLKTPVIAMAILGTQYAVQVASKTQTYIHVTEGHVAADNRILGPGDSVLATPGGIINAPFPESDFLNSENESLDQESAEMDSDETFSEIDIDTDSSDGGDDMSVSADSGGEDAVGLIESSFVVGDELADELEIEEEIEELLF